MVRFAVAFAMLACLSTNLFAHVTLSRSIPAAGSVVHGSPAEVRLWFSDAIEPRFSTVKVVDSSGRQVDKHDDRVERATPTVLRVSLDSLAVGTYTVHWRVVSVDTHVIEGRFMFSVQP
jgi:methionine-rich copper-binding protein CopC